MSIIEAFKVLRYLKRHLKWLAEEGAEAESLDSETCAQFSELIGAEADALVSDESFTFNIDKATD